MVMWRLTEKWWVLVNAKRLLKLTLVGSSSGRATGPIPAIRLCFSPESNRESTEVWNFECKPCVSPGHRCKGDSPLHFTCAAFTCSRLSYCGSPTRASYWGSLPSGLLVALVSWQAGWQHSEPEVQIWPFGQRWEREWDWTLWSLSSALQHRWPFHLCPWFLPSRDIGEAIQLTPRARDDHIRSYSHTWLCINAWHRWRQYSKTIAHPAKPAGRQGH